jgi:hypothetical protein
VSTFIHGAGIETFANGREGGSRKVRGRSFNLHTPYRKIRVQFGENKHTSLTFLEGRFSVNRISLAQERNLVPPS